MDDYVQCPAVVLYAGHLHVLFREGETKRRENQKRQKGLDRLKKVVEGGRRIEKISSRREQIKKNCCLGHHQQKWLQNEEEML